MAVIAMMAMMTPATANVVIVEDSIGDVPNMETDTIVEYICGGNAPSETNCSNGEHVRGGYASHGPVNWAADYTGFIRSSLVHSGGARVWTCGFDQGAFLSCQGTGTWPAAGQDFEQKCQSFYRTGTPAVDNLLISLNIEGGSSDWACRLLNDE